jgi:hypothetical protein
MAAFARASGVEVEAAYFEDWEPRGRLFDLVICAQAWWWLDLEIALPKIAAALPVGRKLAVFWNVGASDDELTLKLRDVYDRIAADAVRVGAEAVREPMLPSPFEPEPDQDMKGDAKFTAVEAARFEWERRYTRDEWVAAAATFGDVIALPRELREPLLASIAATVDAHGGVRTVRVLTSLVTAVRA